MYVYRQQYIQWIILGANKQKVNETDECDVVNEQSNDEVFDTDSSNNQEDTNSEVKLTILESDPYIIV